MSERLTRLPGPAAAPPIDAEFERLDGRLDVLTQVLDAVHLGSVLSSRSVLRAPWALRYGRTEHRAGFHVVAAGRCWAVLDGAAEAVALGPGDVVVFPHGGGHTLADHPATPAVDLETCVAGIAPGQHRVLRALCTPRAAPAGDVGPAHDAAAADALGNPAGAAPYGASGDTLGAGEPTVILCGSYTFAADGAHPLLRGLPPTLHLPADQTRGGPLEAAVRLLVAEAERREPGEGAVVDRLVGLLFVYALRAWLQQAEQRGPAAARTWFGALQDPAVGPAVRAVHDDPAHPWTVEALARRAGLSRAAFARRFQQSVGEPPLAYVTRWRMTAAAELLARGAYIAAVARRVGYENEFAFAKAFKRVRGVSPGQVRRRYQTPAPVATGGRRAS